MFSGSSEPAGGALAVERGEDGSATAGVEAVHIRQALSRDPGVEKILLQVDAEIRARRGNEQSHVSGVVGAVARLDASPQERIADRGSCGSSQGQSSV